MFKLIKAFAQTSLLAMGLLTAAPVFAQAPAPAKAKPHTAAQKPGKPAMWAVTDEDSTVYLLGSFHLLKPDTPWRGGQIDAAFSKSQTVFFEITEFEDTALAQQLIGKYGLSATPDLTKDLTPEEVTQLQATLARLGLPFEPLQRLKPWLMALTIAQKAMADSGYSPAAGVDLNLYKEAKAANKTVRAFETLEDQMAIMAAIGGDGGVDLLRQTLKDDAEGPAKLHELADDWLYGKEPALTKSLITEMKAEHPAMYDALLLKRNNDWMPQVEEIMKGSGVTMIVVGAGHIIGPDGLAAQLKARGYSVKRLQ